MSVLSRISSSKVVINLSSFLNLYLCSSCLSWSLSSVSSTSLCLSSNYLRIVVIVRSEGSFLSFIIRGFELRVLHSNLISIVCQPFGLSFLLVYPCPYSSLLFDSYLRLFNRSSISLSPHLHLTIGIHTRVLVDC